MKLRFWHNWGIKHRTLFVAIAPLILITVILGYYVTTSRVNDIEDALAEKGSTMTRHLAPTIEFALFSMNLEMLSNIAAAVLNEPDVVSITIYDSHNNIVVSNTNEPSLNQTYEQDFHDNDPALLVFHSSIYRSHIPLSNFERELDDTQQLITRSKKEVIGSVVLRLSRASMQEKQNEVLRTGFIILAIGLVISGLLGTRIAKGVTDPLTRILSVTKQLQDGDLGARIEHMSPGELGVLESGINDMAETLKHAQSNLQSEIHAATSELKKTVAELEGKNIQLDEAREQALESGRIKAQFMAKMSHEIRTPLNAVIGFSNMLHDKPASDENREYIRTINQAAKQLLCVIDDILDYSKIESGTPQLEQIVYNPIECFEDVITMLAPEARSKGLELVLLIDSDVPVNLRGDPTRISQVATNLINNAIKFTKKGDVVVHISLDKKENGTHIIDVQVSDTGVGLNRDQLESIFTPFSQADSSISRRFGGTGLGLSISSRLVEMMNGSIKAESIYGQGSVFSFSVPCNTSDIELDDSFGQELNGVKVLTYEAHSSARRALRSLFSSWNMEVFIAGDRGKVTSMLAIDSGHQFHILTLGLSAKEANATDFVDFIRSIRATFSGPILLMIGADEWKLPRRLDQKGNIHWCSKPVRRITLYRNLTRLLCSETQNGDALEPVANKIGETPGDTLQDIRILLVEDNDFNRLLVNTWLKQCGADIDEAENGQQAIDAFQQQRYDIILMDIHMPIMDGMEAAKKIRECENGRTVPIIGLTADVYVSGHPIFKDYHINEFVRKPVSEMVLKNVINKWLNDRESAAITQAKTDTKPSISQQDSDESMISDDMLPRLVSEIKKQCSGIKLALDNKDRKKIKAHAHQLCGITGYFGIPELAASAAAIEQSSLTSEFESISKQVLYFEKRAQSYADNR